MRGAARAAPPLGSGVASKSRMRRYLSSAAGVTSAGAAPRAAGRALVERFAAGFAAGFAGFAAGLAAGFAAVVLPVLVPALAVPGPGLRAVPTPGLAAPLPAVRRARESCGVVLAMAVAVCVEHVDASSLGSTCLR
ncbi:hypothetical protein CBM2634_B170387 [Cupriavidus taiwanensis]|uniref:Uncharacterized protein n=1 Tax=Cupriavidus taiwanensis TaxID=164546 RepID=A0A375JAB6_9BURK|nr:hypothetical protein CBM2634_B170387 [Cupriavidus taiwanensis]